MILRANTNLKAVATVAHLLENEDYDFYEALDSGDDRLDVIGEPEGYGAAYPNGITPQVQLQVWWTVEIEVRRWGIKDIAPFVKKLVLTGGYVDDDGNEIGDEIHYEYPEAARPKPQIGPDVDAPTDDNIMRMSTADWKVEFGLADRERRWITLMPEAEIDLARHTIDVRF